MGILLQDSLQLPCYLHVTSVATSKTNSHKITLPPKSYYTCSPQCEILKINSFKKSNWTHKQLQNCRSGLPASAMVINCSRKKRSPHVSCCQEGKCKAGSRITEGEAPAASRVWQARWLPGKEGALSHPRRELVNSSIPESTRYETGHPEGCIMAHVSCSSLPILFCFFFQLQQTASIKVGLTVLPLFLNTCGTHVSAKPKRFLFHRVLGYMKWNRQDARSSLYLVGLW